MCNRCSWYKKLPTDPSPLCMYYILIEKTQDTPWCLPANLDQQTAFQITDTSCDCLTSLRNLCLAQIDNHDPVSTWAEWWANEGTQKLIIQTQYTASAWIYRAEEDKGVYFSQVTWVTKLLLVIASCHRRNRLQISASTPSVSNIRTTLLVLRGHDRVLTWSSLAVMGFKY